MKFDFSKSSDLQNKFQLTLDTFMSEQRHQRADLAYIIQQLTSIKASLGVQKQVTEFYEDTPQE